MIRQPRLSVVPGELPDPPYPPDTKANGFRPEFRDAMRAASEQRWADLPSWIARSHDGKPRTGERTR